MVLEYLKYWNIYGISFIKYINVLQFSLICDKIHFKSYLSNDSKNNGYNLQLTKNDICWYYISKRKLGKKTKIIIRHTNIMIQKNKQKKKI